MSKLHLFCVRDSKIGVYEHPSFQRSRGEAIRSWAATANSAENAISQFPEDFALFEIGEFDTESGEFKALICPLNLGLAVQFKRPPESPSPLLDMVKK